MKLDLRRIITVEALSREKSIERPAFADHPERLELLQWPSGLAKVQELAGGFYGSTLIGGRQKIGKSITELGSSLEAALSGWTTIYFDGENDWDELQRRIWNKIGRDGIKRLSLWNPILFGRSTTLEDIADQAAMTIDPDDDRVLICIDSINRLAKRMTSSGNERYKFGNGYFRALEDVCEWAQACTKLSGGRIGVMMTSEQNRAGTIVGMDAEYSCQVVLYMRPGTEKGMVKLELLSRRSRAGDLGDHELVFAKCEFEVVRLYSADDDDKKVPGWVWGEPN